MHEAAMAAVGAGNRVVGSFSSTEYIDIRMSRHKYSIYINRGWGCDAGRKKAAAAWRRREDRGEFD